MARRNICVFASSTSGTHAEYAGAARALGRAIGRHNFDLVYGGTNSGLMWLCANAAEAAGAHVVAVVPQGEWEEMTHAATQTRKALYQTPNLQERKLTMIAHADAFIALPGGYGTLDELSEILIETYHGRLQKPIGVLDVRGFFHYFRAFLEHAAGEGFLSEGLVPVVYETQPDVLLERLTARLAAAPAEPTEIEAAG